MCILVRYLDNTQTVPFRLTASGWSSNGSCVSVFSDVPDSSIHWFSPSDNFCRDDINLTLSILYHEEKAELFNGGFFLWFMWGMWTRSCYVSGYAVQVSIEILLNTLDSLTETMNSQRLSTVQRHITDLFFSRVGSPLIVLFLKISLCFCNNL